MARAIRAALAGLADVELVHFGSTAIPGLAAKPIIDIMLIADDRSRWPGVIEHIQGLGYVYRRSGRAAPITSTSARPRMPAPRWSSATTSAGIPARSSAMPG